MIKHILYVYEVYEVEFKLELPYRLINGDQIDGVLLYNIDKKIYETAFKEKAKEGLTTDYLHVNWCMVQSDVTIKAWLFTSEELEELKPAQINWK